MRKIKEHWTYLAGAVLGGIGGFLYWKFVGCSTGTCPITSSPIVSTLYGILLGSLAGGIFKSGKQKTENRT